MNKQEILQMVSMKIADKIQNFEKLIEETRDSNNDTKSSMGDKYETGREMLQQEINNLQRQLNEALQQQNLIKKMNPTHSLKVSNGALVKTNKGIFYISVSMGEIIFDNQKIMTISADSPLAKVMMGLKVDQQFMINSTNQSIENIW
ncbi:hypothetical protein [Chryseobacterium potabilaquae]|uniref:Transcription elongation factor GreB n=1 Tax=Chryseobacterium potabilaquae TaxID=2675057 RepID=A0A6N4XA36_9FLAO|nr:hypothetical protein [Chryseobacterium potabilaquae]CAA7196575.1 Transcription elongation factor GreB [Chryseobacterium potabilaquae]